MAIYQYNVTMVSKYPIFLELDGRCAVLIGGGGVALRKAESLLRAGARLRVAAKVVADELRGLCRQRNVELIEGEYSKDYLAGAVLAVAATDDNKLNKQIYEDCRELGVLCNVVDVPELCDFFVPAVVKRGDLQIAISTNGLCPAYAAFTRKKLEQTFTDEHGEFLIELEKVRQKIIEQIDRYDERKALLNKLVDDESFEYFSQNGSAKWQIFVDKVLQDQQKD